MRISTIWKDIFPDSAIYIFFFTCQYTTGDPWDSLNLCYVVVYEIIITSSIEELGVTEGPPQFCCDRFVVYLDELRTYVIRLRHNGSISQDADAEWETKR